MSIESSRLGQAYQTAKAASQTKSGKKATTFVFNFLKALWKSGGGRTVSVHSEAKGQQGLNQNPTQQGTSLQDRTVTESGPKSILKRPQEQTKDRASHGRHVGFSDLSTMSDGDIESVKGSSTKTRTKVRDDMGAYDYKQGQHASGLSADARAGINAALEESGSRGLETWLSTGLGGDPDKVLMVQEWLNTEGKLDDEARDICQQAFCCEVKNQYINTQLHDIASSFETDQTLKKRDYKKELSALRQDRYSVMDFAKQALKKLNLPRHEKRQLADQIAESVKKDLTAEVRNHQELWKTIESQRSSSGQ